MGMFNIGNAPTGRFEALGAAGLGWETTCGFDFEPALDFLGGPNKETERGDTDDNHDER